MRLALALALLRVPLILFTRRDPLYVRNRTTGWRRLVALAHGDGANDTYPVQRVCDVAAEEDGIAELNPGRIYFVSVLTMRGGTLSIPKATLGMGL